MPTKYEQALAAALIAWAKDYPRAAAELFSDPDGYFREVGNAEHYLARHSREMSPDEIWRAEAMIAAEEDRQKAINVKEAV